MNPVIYDCVPSLGDFLLTMPYNFIVLCYFCNIKINK